MRRSFLLISVGFALGLAIAAYAAASFWSGNAAFSSSPPGMVWIAGGEFAMGSDDPKARADERPTHRVRVDGFWMDKTVVTNAQFRGFVEATGYVTVAERKPDWEELKKQVAPGTPKPPDDVLVAGSGVFQPTKGAVDLSDWSERWRWQPGADWRHPGGPGTSIEGKDSFLSDPPNADISIVEGDKLRQFVVVLQDPVLQGDSLTYTVKVLQGDIPAKGADVSVFIDIIGMPLTPLSFAGVARRNYRRAFYR